MAPPTFEGSGAQPALTFHRGEPSLVSDIGRRRTRSPRRAAAIQWLDAGEAAAWVRATSEDDTTRADHGCSTTYTTGERPLLSDYPFTTRTGEGGRVISRDARAVPLGRGKNTDLCNCDPHVPASPLPAPGATTLDRSRPQCRAAHASGPLRRRELAHTRGRSTRRDPAGRDAHRRAKALVGQGAITSSAGPGGNGRACNLPRTRHGFTLSPARIEARWQHLQRARRGRRMRPIPCSGPRPDMASTTSPVRTRALANVRVPLPPACG